MPKTSKTTGYLVKIEAFVPADLGDMATLTRVQDARAKAIKLLDDAGRTFEPDQQRFDATRR